MRLLTVLLLCGFCLAAEDPRALTKTDIDRWMTELSNWGRWGKGDQMGTVNLITPAKRREAAAMVKEGIPVSLARVTELEAADDNPSPFVRKTTSNGDKPGQQFAGDEYSVKYHGYAHTHMDSLSHVWVDGRMYNGNPASSITEKGATASAVTAFQNGIFTRGVLVDIPRLKGLPYLEPDTAIYPEDIEAWEKRAHVKIASGDVVFFRTGRWARRASKGPWKIGGSSAGLYASCVKWLHQRDVAMVGSDAASDLLPSRIEGVAQPVHQLLINAMGTPIFDNCDLEALGEAAAQRGRWVFLLTAAPIPVAGGTGSPLNPIAVF